LQGGFHVLPSDYTGVRVTEKGKVSGETGGPPEARKNRKKSGSGAFGEKGG